MLVLVFTPLSCVCVSVCVLLIRPFNVDIRGRIPSERVDIVQKHVIGVPDDHTQFVPVVDLKQHTTQIVPPSFFILFDFSLSAVQKPTFLVGGA